MSIKSRLKCPRCGREIILTNEIVNNAIKEAKSFGLHPIAFNHGDHVVTVYVDSEGRIRSIITAEVLAIEPKSGEETVEGAETPVKESNTTPIPSLLITDLVPISSRKTPSDTSLTDEEKLVLSLCDGKRSIKEIAKELSMPYGKVKRIVEALYGYGYIKELRQAVLK